MRTSKGLVCGAVLLVAGSVAGVASADWVFQGEVQGVPTYLDTNTGRVWTVTLGQVRSADWGAEAQGRVQALGFRLPTFYELQAMYNAAGGPVLGIRSGLFDYYETDTPAILGNAFGNGFQTMQPRRGQGRNWYLGVQ